MPRDAPAAGPDGVIRSPAEQKRINQTLAVVFRGDAGKAALDYLRSISIERVCGAWATDAELRHLEGMRFIVAVISQRIAAAHKENQDEPGKPADDTTPSFPTPGKLREGTRARRGPALPRGF